MDYPARLALRFGTAACLLLCLPGSGPAGSSRPGPWAASGFGERDPSSRVLAPAVRYGLLRLEIDPPDAYIALDGESLDKGVWLISMAPGLHYLTVRKEGFLTFTRSIGIGSGESLRISVQLEKEPLK